MPISEDKISKAKELERPKKGFGKFSLILHLFTLEASKVLFLTLLLNKTKALLNLADFINVIGRKA